MGRARSPRTVLFLHGSSGGYGADRQLQVIAAGLDPARYRPLVVLPERGPLSTQLAEAGVEVILSPLAVLRRQLRRGRGVLSTAALFRRNVRELSELARLRRAALVHSNYSIILCGPRVAERSGAAHFLHVREIYADEPRAGDPFWRALRSRILEADAVACVSEAVAAQFPRSDHVFVLPDGITRTFGGVTRVDARQRLGLDAKAFVVTAIGRISDWKGQDVLLRALADPVLADVRPVALLAGDAAPHQRHFETQLATLGDSLGLDSTVRMLGFRDDVDVLLAASDVVVVPSTYPDSLPNAAIDAAAAGVPVVAAAIGGIPEIIDDGATGRLVRPGDPHALAAALRKLADNPEIARRLGRAAAETVRDRFDAARLVDEVQARYDRVLASRPVGPPAWVLPVKRLPLPHPVATDLRAEREVAWLEGLGYQVRLLERGPLGAPGLVLRALRERPALILAGAAIHAPVVAAVKRLSRFRTRAIADVVGLHSLEVDEAFRPRILRPIARRAWRMLERSFVRGADVVLAVNGRHAAIVRQRYRPSNVFTLRDTADVEQIEPLPRAELGVPDDAVVVGFAGSLVYRRLDELFAAWPDIGGEALHLLVVGEGPELERYRALVAGDVRLSRSVVFLGAQPHGRALAALAACDIAFSDCWSEAGFPLKVFEYMALGLPIVTEATPQAAEVLGDGESALFYRTTQELADRLRRLAADSGLRSALGTGARRSYLERHTAATRRREFETLVGAPDAPPRPLSPRAAPALVSVVMPVRNEARHLPAQLSALAEQTYPGAWELVLVDNGSTDGSMEIAARMHGALPFVRVVEARRRGLNHARNVGTAAALGELIAYCDADDVVAPDWLDALVRAAPHADVVAGALELDSLNDDDTVRAWLNRTPALELSVAHDFLPYAAGGNCAVWADVAQELGWDERYRFGSSDVEFSWRAQLAGYRLVYADDAVSRQRFRATLRGVVGQQFRYSCSLSHLYRSFRPYGLRPPGARATLAEWFALAWNASDLVRSHARRGHWLRLAAAALGRLAGGLRRRFLFA